MGAYAGILLGISFCLAWAAIFVPHMAGNRRLMISMAVVSLPCALGCSHLLWGHQPSVLPYYGVVFLLGVYELIAFANRWPTKALPALSILFLFLTAWAPWNLHQIAQSIWAGPTPARSYFGQALEVAVIDFIAMFITILLSVLLWVGLARRRSPSSLLAGAACTLASAVLSALAFCYTGPWRGGDFGEGELFLFIMIPCELLVAMIALVTCITVPAVSLSRASGPPPLPVGLDAGKPTGRGSAPAGPPLNKIKA